MKMGNAGYLNMENKRTAKFLTEILAHNLEGRKQQQ
jgi:hypothetical protein